MLRKVEHMQTKNRETSITFKIYKYFVMIMFVISKLQFLYMVDIVMKDFYTSC